MNWKRIAVWSILTIVSAVAVGFAAGQIFASGWAIIASIFLSSTTWYYFLVRPLQRRRVLHVLATFVLVEIFDRSIPVLLGAPITDFFSGWPSSAYHLGAAMLGSAVARLSSNSSFKPKPLRVSA